MNKTHTINISGIIFYIDENAYESLKGYLNTIRSYFKDSDSCEEIMTDIEARIAEIFTGRINNAKQVVLMADVDHMIAIMGNPEVFKNEDGFEPDNNYKETSSTNSAEPNTRKRIFRDGDDKVLGGVCSGIGSYFNFDPIWIRLAFAVSFFFFGSGLLFYIILWLVIPKARTTAEKLEMRGEKVNINTIEKSLKEEMEWIKNRFNKNVNSPNFNANKSRFRNVIASIVDLAAQLIKGFGKVFFKIIGFGLVFFGIVFLLALLSSIFGNAGLVSISDAGISSIDFKDVLIKFFNTPEQITEAKIAAFLVIGLPVLMFIYKGVKLLFNIKVNNKWLNIATTLLWLFGLGLSIDVLASMSHEFKQKSLIKEKFVIATPTANTLYLNVPEGFDWNGEDDEEYDDEDVHYIHNRWNIFVNNEKGLNFYMPVIDVQRSKTDSFELMVIKSSKGNTKKEAIKRAEAISYSYMVKDSIVILNPKFDVPETEKWRAQRVKIIIKVPLGKSVYFNQKIRPLMYDIDNITNTFDGDMVNHKWTMRAEGLTCNDCGDVNGFKKKASEDDAASADDEENDF